MKHIVSYSIFFIAVVVYWTSTNLRYGNENWKSCIDSDGKGYYSYLPAAFIYQDMEFGFYDTIEGLYFERRHADYRQAYNGHIVNKYYCGTAVALTPFFLGAHALTLIQGGPADGYSRTYALSVNFAALCYLLASLYFWTKLLRLYEVSENHIAFILVAFSLGTNIFYYIAVEPSMSHIYSLFFISVFIYYVKSWFTAPKDLHLIYIGAALGMIALIRPVNAMVVLAIPFLAGSWPALQKGVSDIFRNKLAVIGALVVFGAICFIQLLIYKIQTGDFMVYSYSKEGFLWTDPKMLKVLIGYRKGLFVYTPMAFITLLGLVWVFRRSKFEFFSLLVFFTIVTYVVSAWWNWWYGGSFGMRALLEYYPFFVILFGLAFKVLTKKYLRIGYLTLGVLLVLVCQIQTYQARYYYIHWGEMTKEQYWRVFLRIDWAIQKTHKQPLDLPVPKD